MKLLSKYILAVTIPLLLITFVVDARGDSSIKYGIEWNDNVSTDSIDSYSGVGDVAAVIEFDFDEDIYGEANPINLSYSYSQYIYTDMTDFNLRSHNLFLAKDLNLFDKNINFLYGFSDTRLGGSKFLNLHTFTPTIGFELTENIFLSSSYNYLNKKFFTDPNRDSHTNSLNLNFFLFNDNGYYLFSYKYEDEDTNFDEYDYTAYNLSLTSNHMVTMNNRMIYSINYNDKDYLKNTASISEKRRDKNKSFSVTNEYKFNESVKSQITYLYIDSKSNLKSSDYTENTLSLSLVHNF